MARFCRLFFTLLFSICCILFFSNNFLLRRNRLAHINESKWEKLHSHSSFSRKKVILFIIDALRFDFHERIPIISKTLREDVSHSLLFRFRADPPTTTSQRLRSLLTGSLPVFIEQGQNFNSELIEEQVCLKKERTVVLGDGTWAELLGEQHWMRMRTWPSFNVWDLDGVDDGILRYVHNEVQWNAQNLTASERDHRRLFYASANESSSVLGHLNSYDNWDLLVAHFLGVDHAGHRYGVHHPEMQRKLDQMSNELHTVMSNMHNDTILMVFGDHGMNDHGDHGGATDIETDSALFVFSKGDNQFPPHTESKHRTISQLDFTPTLAWLLQYPIPFGNLGLVIREISIGLYGESAALDAAHTNLLQIFSYLNEYLLHDPHFIPPSVFSVLQQRFDHANSSYYEVSSTGHTLTASDVLLEMETLLIDVADLCRKQWAQFNLPNMAIALALLFCCTVFVLMQVVPCWHPPHFFGGLSRQAGAVLLVAILLLVVHLFIDNTQPDIKSHTLLTLCLLALSLIAATISSMKTNALPPALGKSSLFSLLCYTFLSASVISNSFLVFEDRIVFFLFFSLFSMYMFQYLRRSTHSFNSALLIVISMGAFVQYSGIMVRYRSHGTHHISKTPFDDHFVAWKAFSWMLGSAIIFTIYRHMCRSPNTNHSQKSWAIMFAGELAHFILSVLVVFYWALDSQTSAFTLRIPRVVFGSTLIIWAVLIFMYRQLSTSSNHIMSMLYQSACTVLLLIKGHMYASTYFFMSLQVCFLVWLIQKSTSRRGGRLKLVHIVLWLLMALQYYFAYGQQNTLDTIQWTAAFVGLREFQSGGLVQVLSALLVVYGVFSVRIIHALCLMWIVPARTRTLWVYLQYVLLMLFPVLFSSLCVHVHRRHLMVWAIFAPKFMFDALGFCVCAGVLLLSFVFLGKRQSIKET